MFQRGVGAAGRLRSAMERNEEEWILGRYYRVVQQMNSYDQVFEHVWRLHENDCEVELVDANLLEFDEEEVKRVIGVALLCTQTSPQLRPSMSRAVAMLSGDIEVSAVTTRLGYLTDWKFDDTTNFMTIDTPNVENEYNQFSSSSATTAADPSHSPINAVHEVEEVIGEGR
ncbi:hypothetical protein RHMOL_Rhmol06G0319400 [Rhododendron molle]|uniref:Uncharacterized protein n=1 Tax=Rhododendron molle TaxID=49168 RepID=A0ACC0NJW7_RHOML|nr:hypothetical protein RHMOL_Rhmol06G0319400 [Rhododendron molle]